MAFPDYIRDEDLHKYPQLAQRGATIPDYAPDIEPVAVAAPEVEAQADEAPKRGRPRKVTTDGSDSS